MPAQSATLAVLSRTAVTADDFQVDAADCGRLLECLSLVPDPRKRRGVRHSLAAILAIFPPRPAGVPDRTLRPRPGRDPTSAIAALGITALSAAQAGPERLATWSGTTGGSRHYTTSATSPTTKTDPSSAKDPPLKYSPACVTSR